MDPFTMAMGVAGLALQLGGGIMGAGGAKKKAEAQQHQIQLEQQAEEQRRQYMELDAHRKEMEIVRNQQRARSLALTNSTGQGASQGSGLQGGYGQIAGQSGVNFQGIQQNLEIGRNIFDINRLISQEKVNQAQGGTDMAFGQGLGALGGAFLAHRKEVGQFTKDIFKPNAE